MLLLRQRVTPNREGHVLSEDGGEERFQLGAQLACPIVGLEVPDCVSNWSLPLLSVLRHCVVQRIHVVAPRSHGDEKGKNGAPNVSECTCITEYRVIAMILDRKTTFSVRGRFGNGSRVWFSRPP